jgi:hypothetical protein
MTIHRVLEDVRMPMVAWFWAVAAFSPANMATLSAQALEARCAVMDAVARPLMSLGWIDEHDAPIF